MQTVSLYAVLFIVLLVPFMRICEVLKDGFETAVKTLPFLLEILVLIGD